MLGPALPTFLHRAPSQLPAGQPGHADRWSAWARRHQARSRWFRQRARLAKDAEIAWSASEWQLPY